MIVACQGGSLRKALGMAGDLRWRTAVVDGMQQPAQAAVQDAPRPILRAFSRIAGRASSMIWRTSS